MGAPKSGPAGPTPTIGYPEQRRSVMGNSAPLQQQNQQSQPTAQLPKTFCSGCQRELDQTSQQLHQQTSSIKCVDCGRLFCGQCSTSTLAPDGLVRDLIHLVV